MTCRHSGEDGNVRAIGFKRNSNYITPLHPTPFFSRPLQENVCEFLSQRNLKIIENVKLVDTILKIIKNVKLFFVTYWHALAYTGTQELYTMPLGTYTSSP